MRKTAAVLAAIGLAAWLAGCSSGENLDPRELADALSEEFTDEVEFENGTKQDGPPPEEHADDPNYPQIPQRGLIAPLVVEYDMWFDITLMSSFVQSDQVIGAVVYIEQANKNDAADSYIEIIPPAPALSNGAMYLMGRISNPSQQLGGNAFKLKIAMLLDDGAGRRGVGNYAYFYLITPEVAGVNPKVPQCCCEDHRIEIIGQCDDLEVAAALEGDMMQRCGVWEQTFMEYNSNIDIAGMPMWVDMPWGTQTSSWFSSPMYQPCTLQLQCE